MSGLFVDPKVKVKLPSGAGTGLWLRPSVRSINPVGSAVAGAVLMLRATSR